MDELREKYLKILGLDGNPTETQINKQYDYISMRARLDKTVNFDEATKAHDYLVGLNQDEPVEVRKIVKTYRRLWFKHIGTIVTILIIFATILSIAIPYFANQDPDLTISYVGDYAAKSNDDIQQYLYDRMSDVDKILLEVMIASSEGNDATDTEESIEASYVEKLSLLLISGDLEIIICDDIVYRYILKYNYFLPLEGVLEEMDITIPEEDRVYGIESGTGEKVIYGVDVSDVTLIAEHLYVNELNKMILCISNESKNMENVKSAVKLLLESNMTSETSTD
ncbi:MAG: hypothetical protein WCY62_00030 [Clostridia bacterium]|jgi:hypothetical protein